MTTQLLRAVLPVALAVVAGCDGEREDFRDCSGEDVSLTDALPTRLSETGLYDDIEAEVVAQAAIAFTPRFPLWTDTASKRRWLLLPDGGVVDTQDPEDWVFPVGTQTFKEFSRDGVRVETRLNQKTANGWAAATYLWDADGLDATLTLDAATNAGGTAHDVPAATECAACHGGRGDFTLGFSAVQLDELTRAELYDAGVLSDPVDTELALSDAQAAGLGYLHGNCSHCHNPTRDQQPQATDCYTPGSHNAFDLSLPSDLSSAQSAPAVRTASDQLGSPGDSKVLARMSTRNQDDERPSMPPLGTELVDDDGVDAVRAFLQTL